MESVLKDHPVGHNNMVLLRQVVFDDRFNYIELWDLLPGVGGSSRQVVSHGSGLLRQVSL